MAFPGRFDRCPKYREAPCDEDIWGNKSSAGRDVADPDERIRGDLPRTQIGLPDRPGGPGMLVLQLSGEVPELAQRVLGVRCDAIYRG